MFRRNATINAGDGPLTAEEKANGDIVTVNETGKGNSAEYLTRRIVRDRRGVAVRRIILTMTRRSLPAPKDLGAPGVALWRKLTKEFDFNSAEIELAHQLCVTVDEETAMRAELAGMGVTVSGSKGQPVLNPVFAQLAVHRKLIDQLTVALSLPLEGENVGRRRSAQAKLNADSGWRKIKSGGKINQIRRMQGGGSGGAKAS